MRANEPSRRVGRFAALALVVLWAAGAACALTGPSGPHREEQSRLDRAARLWHAQGLLDYSYVFSRSCFCVAEFREPATVVVRGSAIVSVQSVAGGVPRDPASYQPIEGLFEIIQEAIDENAAAIRVEYDAARGYPTQAYIDRDQRIADEEISFEAKALTPAR